MVLYLLSSYNIRFKINPILIFIYYILLINKRTPHEQTTPYGANFHNYCFCFRI